jgi:hypothetical protein
MVVAVLLTNSNNNGRLPSRLSFELSIGFILMIFICKLSHNLLIIMIISSKFDI